MRLTPTSNMAHSYRPSSFLNLQRGKIFTNSSRSLRTMMRIPTSGRKGDIDDPLLAEEVLRPCGTTELGQNRDLRKVRRILLTCDETAH